jgi:hypothetical protein
MRERVVNEREGSYRLLEGNGTLTLEVLVGTVALYAVRMALTPEEAAQFRSQGVSCIEALAQDVTRREAHYRSLGRTQPV